MYISYIYTCLYHIYAHVTHIYAHIYFVHMFIYFVLIYISSIFPSICQAYLLYSPSINHVMYFYHTYVM